jgi:integrase/recombinase XerD
MESHSKRNRSTNGLQTGLPYEVQVVLSKVMNPDDLMNPWPAMVRLRNQMVIMIFNCLGIRSSELLNLRVNDLDFGQRQVLVRGVNARGAYARSRILHMPGCLATLMLEYISSDRGNYPKAMEHDFLVVSCQDGSPLTPSSLRQIFAAISRNVRITPIEFRARYFRMVMANWQGGFNDDPTVPGAEL